MKKLFLLSLLTLSILLSGCKSGKNVEVQTSPTFTFGENEVIQVTELQQIQEIPFENGEGRAIIIFEGNVVDCIIYTKGLDPKEKYTISLIGDDGNSPGVMFGPKENVQIRVGSLEGEVIFKPNSEGELFVSMRNPIRILTSATKGLIFKIASEKSKVIIKTVPFLLLEKET